MERVVYSSAITRTGCLDSWDIENLKYIRKISQLSIRGRNENNRPGIGEDETISIFEEPIQVSKDLLIIPKDFDGKQKPVQQKSFPRFGSSRLSDCYLLDVVTVQNDSMIALCDQNNRSSKPNTPDLLSTSDSTKDMFESNAEDSSEESIASSSSGSRDGSCCSSVTTSTIINGAKRGTPKQKGCPFCKDSFFFLGEGGNDVSLVPTIGGESPPQCPRSPSPYYVRLRKELPKSISPSPQQPKNFGMNRQGHLVIDYSPNWNGLENYIKNLKR